MNTDNQPVVAAGTISVRNHHRAESTTSDRGTRRRSRRYREGWEARAVVAGAAIAGLFVAVEPSGNRLADRLMGAVFVALFASAGTSAKRWSWAVTAAAALAMSDGRVAMVLGLVALGLTVGCAGPIRPVPAVGAAVGALAGLALLRATDIGFHGSSALVVGLVGAPLLVSGYRHAGRRTRRRLRRAAAGVAVAAGLATAAYIPAAASARPKAERGLELLHQGMEAARAGDDEQATAKLSAAADAFAAADRQLNSWYTAPASLVPILGHNVRAAAAMASAAADVSRDGTDVALDADIDSLTVREGRLDLDQVRRLTEPLDGVASVLAAAGDDLDAAEGGWLLGPIADHLDEVRSEVSAARPDVELAADATRVIPAIFGGEGSSRWLVAFVTPVEARGRTGFMGNFAELTASDGVVDMTRFGRAGELETGGTPAAQRTLAGPEDYLAHWNRFAPAATWRNVTMSPDFRAVGEVMAQLYPQSGGQQVDGVIAIDPVALAALMNFTGPITVPELPEPLTAASAASFLLRDQYVAFGHGAERIDTLETVAQATFDRLTTGTLPSPEAIGDILGPVVSGGHLHVYGTDPAHQSLFTDLGLDGALPEVEGDSLGIVANNAVGNKVDLFLQRAVEYDAEWNPDTGELAATASVTLTNTSPSTGLPEHMIGSQVDGPRRPPPGTNRTYLSVYTPWRLEGARVDGQDIDMERQVEAGRYSYSVFLDIPPDGGTRTITLELRGQLDPGDDYTLDVSTQPLVNPDRWSLALDVAGSGRVAADEPLVADGRHVSATDTLTREVTTYRVEYDS